MNNQPPGMMSAASPLPQVEITPTPAAGKTGPVGMAPRTNYSRVNTGIPPVPDAGGGAQKTIAPRGAEMLPKTAGSEVSMNGIQSAVRPTLSEMIKSAQAGALSRASVHVEAERQEAGIAGDGVKTAAAAPPAEVASMDIDVEKLAAALDFLAEGFEKEANIKPGEGPNALQVHESAVGGKQPFKPGNQGHGHAGQVAKSPAEQSAGSPGPATQMANNMGSPSHIHEHQATSMVNQKGSKTAAAEAAPVDAIRKLAAARKVAAGGAEAEKKEGEGMEEAEKGLAKAEKAHASEKEKDAGMALLAAAFGATTKTAEDAINPAHISAGAAVPPDTRAGGESGGVAPKGSTGLIASNEAARDYKRGAAKSDPKSDLKAYVNEPALSGATDKTLSMAFNHTGEAGTKFASAQAPNPKTVAAKTLFAKIAAAAAENGQ